MHPHFQLRFALIFIAVILISVIAVSLLQQRGQGGLLEEMHETTVTTTERALLDQVRKKGQNIAQLIAAILTNPLYRGEMRTIGEISMAVRKRSDVDYFYVLDPKFNVIHDGTKQIEQYGRRMSFHQQLPVWPWVSSFFPWSPPFRPPMLRRCPYTRSY